MPFKAHHGATPHQDQRTPRLLALGSAGGLVMACLLSACGQKGPLFMPTERSLAPLSLSHPRGETPPTFAGPQVASALPASKH
jgi:predicted small lipoprotein YifL